MSTHTPSSQLKIHGLRVRVPKGVALSAFSLPCMPCTMIISLTCHLLPSAIPASALVDDLPADQSIDYSALSKILSAGLKSGPPLKGVPEGAWLCLERFSEEALKLVIERYGASCYAVEIETQRERALLFSDSVAHYQKAVLSASMGSRTPTTGSKTRADWRVVDWNLAIKQMLVRTIIGLRPYERLEKQQLAFDITVDLASLYKGMEMHDIDPLGFDYKTFGILALDFIEKSSYQTLESLVHHLTFFLLPRLPTTCAKVAASSTILSEKLPKLTFTDRTDVGVTVEVFKRDAISNADHPSIKITRTLQDQKAELNPAAVDTTGTAIPSSPVRAYIAIGSNVGDRIDFVGRAVKELCQGEVKLVRTSRLFESKAMYVEDQADFLNGAFEVETTLSPVDLLRRCKQVENSLGRVKTIVNGPRAIDLDVLFYDTQGAQKSIMVGKKGDAEGSVGEGCGWLEVPHWGIGEREFVLRPLVDIVPPSFIHVPSGKPVPALLEELQRTTPQSLKPAIPFPAPASVLQLVPHRPLIMAILNVTPDSFSDGSAARVPAASADPDEVDPTQLDHVLAIARQLIADGANILDVGGMSTRPGVKDDSVSENEELARVIPVIQALRLDGVEIPISIDTFRPAVAEQAIAAGASCINDVRGGREEGMLEMMAKLDVPVILMHSRGDSVTMQEIEAKDYSRLGGVVKGVTKEMKDMVERAEKSGIKRWNIILDPGLGFAKSVEGHLSLLKSLDTLVGPGSGLEGYPLLVGGSRKGFVGTVTGRTVATEREFGNAAITAICAQSQSAGIVRVHEVRGTKDVREMIAAVLGAD